MKSFSHIFPVLLMLSLSSQAFSAPKDSKQLPRLVLGIHLDQLQEEYLQWFMEGFGEEGFKLLLKQGKVYDNCNYELSQPDAANTSASLLSGCPPMYHGIIAGEWFNREFERLLSCVYDKNYLGNYTTSTFSPLNLRSSTVGDELKKASNGRSKVFSLGLEPEAPILAGGRSADAAIWMDDQSGNWCSSTYYNYMPVWLQQVNDYGLFEAKAAESSWKPKFPLSRYVYMPHQKNPNFFNYALSVIDKAGYEDFKQTPMANTELNQLAIELIDREKLGQDEYPDLLMLHFNTGSQLSGNDSRAAFEMQDLYFRLDEDLAWLLKEIDRRIGLDNSLIYLCGSGTEKIDIEADEKAPGFYGNFYPERSAALLNLYLTAIYGSERWVQGCSETEIYLNRKRINELNLDYQEICNNSALFLTQVEGIQQVVPAYQLLLGDQSRQPAFGLNFYKERSGDLLLRLENGRNIRWESFPGKNRQIQYAGHSTLLLFYGAGIKASSNSQAVSIFDLAPTLSRILYIRPPTSSTGKTLF
ncbi:MAG: alkaline phosphatase family protein [Bacteroidales bacterium]